MAKSYQTIAEANDSSKSMTVGALALVMGAAAAIAFTTAATTNLPVTNGAVVQKPATLVRPVQNQRYPIAATSRALRASQQFEVEALQPSEAVTNAGSLKTAGWAMISCGMGLLLWSASKLVQTKKTAEFSAMVDDFATFAVTGQKVVGIDLGTTNSAIAVMEGGDPQIITNNEGGRTTPSVVAYTKGGELLVGAIAKRQAVVNPENTFTSVKRFIGRRMTEVTKEDMEIPYAVEKSADGNIKLVCPNMSKQYAPEEISAQVLRKLVGDASKFLGVDVTKAVITVPAYFNDSQRQATKDAGRIAGLEVLRIINEPTAASLAYGLDKKGQEATILVFDLGGGTFDVSVLEVGDGVFEVLSTSGDTHLGGDDFDKAIVEWLAAEFKKVEGIDLLKDKQALQRLTEASEKAKQELSQTPTTEISLPFITSDATGPKHIQQTLTRAKFNQLTSSLIDRCRAPVERALKDAGMTMKDLDEIVLVGGSTRIPAVKELVEQLTQKKPDQSVNVDEVVALGAAVQGGVLSGDVKDIVLLDVTPLSLGLETLGGIMTKVIPRNTTLPAAASEVFSTAADGQTTVDIRVMQGERQFAKDNKLLGTFRLDGIPPAPRGVPQIEVKFDIDTNGILSVTATDKGTGKQQDIKITGASTLSDSDVERMVKDAETFAAEDEAKKKEVETKNQAENMVYQTEKQLKEFDEKLPEATKEKVKGSLEPLKTALAQDRVNDLQPLMDKLQEDLMSMGQAMYGQGAAAGGDSEPQGGASKKDDDVIDADYSA